MRKFVAEFFGTFALVFAGPISRASMNPARSPAPALIAGRIEALWIYIFPPLSGAILAVPGCRCVHERECCLGTATPR